MSKTPTLYIIRKPDTLSYFNGKGQLIAHVDPASEIPGLIAQGIDRLGGFIIKATDVDVAEAQGRGRMLAKRQNAGSSAAAQRAAQAEKT